ncbi:MAG: hypothetical protein P1V97_38595 [Planctomycetota bacterium]|nr:hypothetical protein [Planctomycetota bacterium]
MAKRSQFFGYLALILISTGTLGLALYLGWQGLDLFMGETSREVGKADDFMNQSENLESALLRWSFAVLSLLTSFISFFALFKSIIDDVSRNKRGSIDAETWAIEKDQSKKPSS